MAHPPVSDPDNYTPHAVENDLEARKISRRELLRRTAIGGTIATAASVIPGFAAAGKPFKTIGLSHISYTVKDYRVTRDFYADLMGMKVTVDNGRPNEAILTWSRGPREYMIVRNHKEGDPNTGPVIDHIGFEIADWDTKGVEEELKRRGYTPRADTEDSWFVKDPDGYNLQICGIGLNAVNPVYKPNASPSSAPAGKAFQTAGLSHLSYRVKDYRATRDFYVDLMGMKIETDGSRPNETILSWSHGVDEYLIARNHAVRPGETADPDPKPFFDHFAFTIENWDAKAVEAELKRRGLEPRPDTADSFIVKDPDGFTLQICGPGMSAANPVYTPKPK